MTFPKWRIIRCALALWLAGCAALLPVRGQQDATELAALYNGAMVAFQQGKWGETVQGLEKFISMIVDPKQQATLHPIYFTLGAAYFNMENYGKAIEIFDTYLKKFPNAERVIDVKLGLAQACLLSNQYERAIKLYEQLETIPEHREQALTAQVRAYKEMRKFDDAVRVLEKLVGAEIGTSAQANAAIELAQLHADRNQPEKAVVLLDKLQTKTAIIENLVALNNVAIKLGDEFAEKELFREAIQAYRAVRMRHEVLKFQTERIASMERRMTENLRTATGNPQLFVQMTQTNNAIKAAHAEAKTLLTEFEKLPDFAPALLLRMGKCWHDWDRKWEAIVVYERVLQKYPEAKEREAALYAKIISYTDLALPARTQAFCEQYIKEFPGGPNAGIVGYLTGAVALQANDPKSAESYFGTMLEKQPDSTYREEMRMLLGNARFMQGKHDEATKDYRKYITDYPKGQFIEEVIYRLAVTQLFGGEYEAALVAVKEYLSTYPSGSYVTDARYRHAVCQYALQRYDQVVQECKSWIAGFPDNEQEGEVQALLGDALAAQNKPEEAIPAYVRSSKSANNSEVVNYSLFEASKHLQKLGKWAEVTTLFEEFVRDQPNSEAVVAAMYWIGRAKAQQGKVDEAKAFLVETLRKYIEEPKREAVEQLISQLAQLCSKRPRPVPAQSVAATPAPSGGVAASNAPAPDGPADSSAPQLSSAESATPVAESAPAEPPPYDPFAELDKQLAPLAGTENNTAKARLLYARAELAALRKRAPEQEKIYREIADRFNPMDLSPVLLSVIGDFLLQSGDVPRAATLFQRLKEDFPRSDYLDTAYVGLGEIALREKDFSKALELFTDALDKVAASMKTKEATIGKAKALFALGKYEEARKYFEQIASVREWRGESTAFAVYSLGEIEAHQNRLPEAIAHFRRVFVAYQKFLPWVAKAYIRAADTFEKMGKREDAIENLREMLRNERLEKFPEVQEARKRLEQWGAAA